MRVLDSRAPRGASVGEVTTEPTPLGARVAGEGEGFRTPSPSPMRMLGEVLGWCYVLIGVPALVWAICEAIRS